MLEEGEARCPFASDVAIEGGIGGVPRLMYQQAQEIDLPTVADLAMSSEDLLD